ncbi:hypothetical protein L0F63_005462 [Massospora cicadina]|nr:hypothetical protein L0F63_005462 [Massospora cicadina]
MRASKAISSQLTLKKLGLRLFTPSPFSQRIFNNAFYSTSESPEYSNSKVTEQPSITQPSASTTEPSSVFTDTNDFADSGDEWSRSFFGVGFKAFDKEITEVLLAPLDPKDVEIKPDGILYLPEIKYRRILNKAFGPGAWGLVPRGPSTVTAKNISREYALICHGRFVSQARGEQDYFDKADISIAAEGAKSTALTRCCKDLGIASELW